MSPLTTASPPDVALELVARPENVAVVRHAVAAVAGALEIDAERRDDIVLAVGEACANVVMHAYPGAPPGPLGVAVHIEPPALRVVVWDRGGGVAPRIDSPGLGLGLPLIGRLSDAVEFVHAGPDRAEVRMTFRLEPGGWE